MAQTPCFLSTPGLNYSELTDPDKLNKYRDPPDTGDIDFTKVNLGLSQVEAFSERTLS